MRWIVAIANGIRTRDELVDGKRVVRYTLDQPIPTYVMATFTDHSAAHQELMLAGIGSPRLPPFEPAEFAAFYGRLDSNTARRVAEFGVCTTISALHQEGRARSYATRMPWARAVRPGRHFVLRPCPGRSCRQPRRRPCGTPRPVRRRSRGWIPSRCSAGRGDVSGRQIVTTTLPTCAPLAR